MQNAWHVILQLMGFLLTRQDLAKFNAFFIDAEEDAIIQLSFLQEQLVAAKRPRETAAAKAAFVHFHGALVQRQKLPHGSRQACALQNSLTLFGLGPLSPCIGGLTRE